MSRLRIGIDLGGTKVERIILDENGNIHHKKRIATPHGDYQGALTEISELVWEAEAIVGEKCTVGIGTPGAISQKTGLMKNANSTCLNHQPLHKDLEKKLQRKIRISNDANCFALSEASDGAAENAQCVFGVIIGTGAGSGIVFNGQIMEGANKIGGEWGHNPMPWPNSTETPGPACYCGLNGCIETFLSGPGLAADYFRTFPSQKESENLSTFEIVARAENNNGNCEVILQRYEERLARALSHIINIIDPNVIVLGGGMSNIKRLYENVPKIWGKTVFSDQVLTELKPPKFGDSSGVRGAARLWGMNEDDGHYNV